MAYVPKQWEEELRRIHENNKMNFFYDEGVKDTLRKLMNTFEDLLQPSKDLNSRKKVATAVNSVMKLLNTDSWVRETFMKYGPLNHCNLLMDPKTGEVRKRQISEDKLDAIILACQLLKENG